MVTGLIGLWRWLLGFVARFENLTKGKSNLIFLGVMLTAFIIGMSIAVQINQWRRSVLPSVLAPEAKPSHSKQSTAQAEQTTITPADQQNLSDEQRLILYETEHYPKLHQQRLALYEEMKFLQNFVRDLDILAEQLPKQRELLRGIRNIRLGTFNRLSNRYLLVSQELRRFWVHYMTVSKSDAEAKFKQQAEVLTSVIQEAMGDTLDDRRQEELLITNHIQGISKLLKTNQLPDVSAGITSYTDQNRNLVVNGMREPPPEGLRNYLLQLASQRSDIHQRLGQIKQYQSIYPDLNDSLERTAQLWREALQHNLYADYRLIYALEIEYILQQLNMNVAQSQRKRLKSDVEAALPRIMDNMIVKMADAEEAYSPALKSNKTKNNKATQQKP